MIIQPDLPQDTSDYLRPVALTVTFALDNTTKPGPVLDEGSPTSVRKLVSSATPCPGPGSRHHPPSDFQEFRELTGRPLVKSSLLPTFPQLYSLLAFPSAHPLSSRSPSQRTVVLTMNVSQTWCFELIWISEAPGWLVRNWASQSDLRQRGRDLKETLGVGWGDCLFRKTGGKLWALLSKSWPLPLPPLTERPHLWFEVAGAKSWCQPPWRTGRRMPTTLA